MDNLKFPKHSYFIPELGNDYFEVINNKLVFKRPSQILAKTDIVAKHNTKDGASAARFVSFKTTVDCYSECEYTAGFLVKQRYKRPGKGNDFPENHLKGRPYHDTVTPANIASGTIAPASLRALEQNVLSMIKADHQIDIASRFFEAFKGIVINDKAGTATITLDGVDHAGVTLDAANIKAIDGLMAIEIAGGNVLIFATEDGSYFELSSLVTSTIVKEGIIIVGTDPNVSFDLMYAERMDTEFFELFAVNAPAVSGMTYTLRFLGDEALNVDSTFANAAAFSLADVYSTVLGDKLYITSGAKVLNEIVVLPGTAVTVYPTFDYLSSGNGSWPTMETQKLYERFIGRYRQRFGEHQNVPTAKRHVELSFEITGTTGTLSDGASTSAGFKTRVSFVIPYEVYKNNSDLIAL